MNVQGVYPILARAAIKLGGHPRLRIEDQGKEAFVLRHGGRYCVNAECPSEMQETTWLKKRKNA